MSETVRLTVGALECVFVGHKISDQDERRLSDHITTEFDTVCDRCHYPLRVEDDPNDNISYFVTER